MFKFITGKPLWANVLFGIGVIILVLFLFMQSLNMMTKHGSTLVIPSVTGMSYDAAKKELEAAGFEVRIQDSIFNDTAKALSVLRQFPEGESIVKINRTVYLTINRAVAPEVEMPQLEGLSFRSAALALKQYQLKLKDTSYKTGFAENSVMEQYFEGRRIKAGTKIPAGSGISLVLSSGLGMDAMPVPDLYGKTYIDAKVLLESYGLSLGAIRYEGTITDSGNAFIYSQQPTPATTDGRVNMIRAGQFINISVQAEKPADRVVVQDSVPATQP